MQHKCLYCYEAYHIKNDSYFFVVVVTECNKRNED